MEWPTLYMYRGFMSDPDPKRNNAKEKVYRSAHLNETVKFMLLIPRYRGPPTIVWQPPPPEYFGCHVKGSHVTPHGSVIKGKTEKLISPLQERPSGMSAYPWLQSHFALPPPRLRHRCSQFSVEHSAAVAQEVSVTSVHSLTRWSMIMIQLICHQRLTVSVFLDAAVVHDDVIGHGKQANVDLLQLVGSYFTEHWYLPPLLVCDKQIVLRTQNTRNTLWKAVRIIEHLWLGDTVSLGENVLYGAATGRNWI